MPAKDIYHDNCKQALIKDGWIITHDPYNLKIGRKDLFIDLAGEKLITAEKDTQKIAVEIKSFISPSGSSGFCVETKSILIVSSAK